MAATHRKLLLLAMSKDIRVMIVIESLRTGFIICAPLKHLRPDKQRRILK